MRRFFRKRLPAFLLTLVMVMTMVPAVSARSSADLTCEVEKGESVSFRKRDFRSLYRNEYSNETPQYIVFTDYSDLDDYGYLTAKNYRGKTINLSESDLNNTWFYYDSDNVPESVDYALDDLTFVASDGHKLVRLRNLSVKSPERASFILPKKPANLLKGLLSKEGEMVSIKFDDNNAYINCVNFEMVCRLIEGRYPNYNSVIPQENPFKVTIDRISFLNALKRVSVFSNPASSLVKLQLKENEMLVSAQDIDFSTSAEEKIVCSFDGTELSIGFKATYLIEILSNINSEEVILELADPSRAGLIVPSENEENEDLLMLLMPMMLND